MQRRVDPDTSVNKPFENGSCQGGNQKIFEGGSINFRHFFQAYFFPAELFLSNLSVKNDSRGVRGHALPESL